MPAAHTLAGQGRGVDMLGITSWSGLARDGELHGDAGHLHAMLSDTPGPVIAASAYARALPETVWAFVPAGRRYQTLRTDGFGRSDKRDTLRRFLQVDAGSTALAAKAAPPA